MPRRFRRSFPLWVLAAAAFAPAREARAWGPHAHRIAARVTESRLTPEARAAVRELLHEGDSLLTVCTWADEDGHDAVPGSGPWHFVNVPITAERYDPRDCRGGNCVVAKIGEFRKVLADRRRPKAERARALLFFVHLVQDVHQPLHVGDNRDRGGNQTQVTYQRETTNLHRVWDSVIVNEVDRDERAWVGKVAPLLTPENVAEWSKGGVEDWADESLQAAKKAYRSPVDSNHRIASGDRLGRDYVDFAVPEVRLRLAQAGVRLANELNAVFRKEPVRTEREAVGAGSVRGTTEDRRP